MEEQPTKLAIKPIPKMWSLRKRRLFMRKGVYIFPIIFPLIFLNFLQIKTFSFHSSGPNQVKSDYYSSYEAPRYGEGFLRSSQTQAKETEYKSYEVKNDFPINTDYKTFEVKTDFDKKGIVPYDYRTGNFATYEYKPTEYKPTEYKTTEYKPMEYKPTEYKPIEYVEYQPTAYKVTEFVVNDYKPSTEVYKERSEDIKRAGVTTEVFIEKKIQNDGNEEAQIRIMAQEIERIRSSNSDTFNRFSRLQSEKSEITLLILQKESEIEILRRQGGNNREILMLIEEKNREIERLKISSGGVRIVENPKEVDDLLKLIKEADHNNDILRRKIEELELQKRRYLAEMDENRGAINKSRPAQTNWCC